MNTEDPDFKVIKTSYIPSTVSNNYTFHIYGYQFTKSVCCKETTNSSGKIVPCYNTYSTPIVAPDGSTKLFCPNHVRVEVKAYKLEIKKKAIENKLLAKQQALISAAENKALISAAKKEKALISAAKNEINKVPTLCLPCSCTALLKTGLRKGEACGLNANKNNLCKRHQPK